MDPLGAPSQFVDVDTLLSWGDSYEDEVDCADSTAEAFQEDASRSPFVYSRDVNGKVVLWKGDVALLKDKIHHVDSLQQLFSAISPEQIDFPPFVLEYDARENGPYFASYPPSPDL